MFNICDKVEVVEGNHKGKTGEVILVYPPGILDSEEVIQVSFNSNHSGQFKKNQIKSMEI